MVSTVEADGSKARMVSMLGPLSNKIKLTMESARKNKALTEKLRPLIQLLTEQLLPAFIAENISNASAIRDMHNLWYLFSLKTQQVFTSKIIHTCIDQNWDLKGFKQVLVRILRSIGCQDLDQITNLLDYQIKTQNLQSSACIRAIGSFIRNPKKKLNDDDLSNPISTYETDYAFIEEDIIKYRSQRIKHECFSVLHPWAYDLDKVDFKYIMNNDLAGRIVSSLKT